MGGPYRGNTAPNPFRNTPATSGELNPLLDRLMAYIGQSPPAPTPSVMTEPILGGAIAGLLARALGAGDEFATGLVKGGMAAGKEQYARQARDYDLSRRVRAQVAADAFSSLINTYARHALQREQNDYLRRAWDNALQGIGEVGEKIKKGEIAPEEAPAQFLMALRGSGLPPTEIKAALTFAEKFVPKPEKDRYMNIGGHLVQIGEKGKVRELKDYSKKPDKVDSTLKFHRSFWMKMEADPTLPDSQKEKIFTSIARSMGMTPEAYRLWILTGKKPAISSTEPVSTPEVRSYEDYLRLRGGQ